MTYFDCDNLLNQIFSTLGLKRSIKIISGNKKPGTRPGCLFVRSLTMTYFDCDNLLKPFVSSSKQAALRYGDLFSLRSSRSLIRTAANKKAQHKAGLFYL